MVERFRELAAVDELPGLRRCRRLAGGRCVGFVRRCPYGSGEDETGGHGAGTEEQTRYNRQDKAERIDLHVYDSEGFPERKRGWQNLPPSSLSLTYRIRVS